MLKNNPSKGDRIHEFLPGGKKELEKILHGEKKLIIKYGIDPRNEILHIGHGAILNYLREFQRFGHKAVIVIGDYTARNGDPTHNGSVREPIPKEKTLEYGLGYKDKILKILDPDPSLLEIKFNSGWLDAPNFHNETFTRVIRETTLSQLIEKEDFRTRRKERQPIGGEEIYYQVYTAIDSLMVNADIEIGGTDQKHNILFARDMQHKLKGKLISDEKIYDGPEQYMMTFPILTGTDGSEKMSKSKGNYIAVDENPVDMYGKTMRIPDDLIYTWGSLLGVYVSGDLKNLKNSLQNSDGRDLAKIKKDLAYRLVNLYHNKKAAEEAAQHFENKFVKKKNLYNEEFVFNCGGSEKPSILDVVVATETYKYTPKKNKDKEIEPVVSKGESRRVIQQGGVKINGDTITDINYDKFDLNKEYKLSMGKHHHYTLKFEEQKN